MAFIEKRGKVWRVRYKRPDGTYGTDPDKFTTKTAAKQRAEDIEARQRDGKFTDPKRTTKTLGEYVPEWFERMRFEPPNEKTKRSHWRTHIEPRWGAREFRSIVRTEVQDWVNDLRDTVGGRMVNAVYGTFKQIMRHAEVDDYVTKNPCVLIDLPDGSAAEREPATPLEVLLLARAVEPFHPLVVTTAYTGFRWGEVTGLLRPLAKTSERRLYVHNRIEPGTLREGKPRKGASYRDVAITDWMAEMLDEQLDSHTSEYVFPSERGKVLRPKAFRELWLPARDKIKPGFNFHDLRHTHETWMEEDGTPEVLRNKRMGHKSSKMNQRYSHVTPRMERTLMGHLTRRWRQSLKEAAALDRKAQRQQSPGKTGS